MNKSKYSPEVRERAVRMVQEHRGEYPSLWAAVDSIAGKIGCVPQTLLTQVQRHEVDTGVREGVSTAEARRVKELERENKELRRARGARVVSQDRSGEIVQGCASGKIIRYEIEAPNGERFMASEHTLRPL